jgi:hypothetical protein
VSRSIATLVRGLSIAMLAVGACGPARALELDELMRQLAARGAAAASFVEEQHLASLDRPLRSSGELVYHASGELEKRTLLPRAETLRYARGRVSSERGGRRTELDLRRYPQLLPLVESIRATLAGDRPALEKLFVTTLEGDEARWRLRLAPRDAAVLRLVREVRVEGSGTQVLSLELERGNGDRSVTTMSPHPP